MAAKSGRGTALAVAAIAVMAVALPASQRATAETLPSALAKAYRNNPQLNAQRAIVRQTDEEVPQALSGYRPNVAATASVGRQYNEIESQQSGRSQVISGATTPRSVGLSATQTLFNGFQTANNVRAAESQVSAARETLRLMEQTVLLDAATAYMDNLRDRANLETQRRNVEVLEEQLRQTRDRFNVGEVTRTDVAQAEARLAAARSSQLGAEATLTTSRAFYRRVIGDEPNNLAPGSPVDRFLPRTLDAAVASGRARNPNVTAAMFGVDVALLQVKIAQGALYPTLTLQGSVQQSYDTSPSTVRSFGASLIGQLSIPIYQGGDEYSLVRQNKELLGQKRLDLETFRNQAREDVVRSWGQLTAARAQIEAAEVQVRAAETALNGVREEARVGQRTTLDVLNAQQELVNARISLVIAQRDRVVASYALLAAVGRLSPQVLGLPTELYDPMVHYQQIRDSWFGLRIPDGR